jgi:3-hydroxybutyryl-CoA dehydrogenase
MDQIERIAIIGAGTMGLGVAECFAVAGLRVCLTDATPELARQAIGRLRQRVQGHVDAGLLPPAAFDRAATVEAADDIAATVRDRDLVFEAAPEDPALKHDVLRAIAAAARPDTSIATNTSSLPIDDLAPAVTGPERFLGMHWFNPPEWTPGVEVIPGAATAPEVVARVKAFLLAAGKRPAVVRSAPCFVANRIQNALFREALACVEEGLATPAEVDEVVRSTFGFRLPFFGPFQIADMAGLDVYASVFGTMERELGPAWRAPALLREQVAQGRIGTKGGAGFYTYDDAERGHLLLERDRRYAALNRLLADFPPIIPPERSGDQAR